MKTLQWTDSPNLVQRVLDNFRIRMRDRLEHNQGGQYDVPDFDRIITFTTITVKTRDDGTSYGLIHVPFDPIPDPRPNFDLYDVLAIGSWLQRVHESYCDKDVIAYFGDNVLRVIHDDDCWEIIMKDGQRFLQVIVDMY